MRSYQHDVGSHAKRLAGRARNRVTRKHVCNANFLGVLRPSSEDILDKLKENAIETSRVVMRGTGWWTREASPIIGALTENSPFAALAGRIIRNRRAVCYEL